MADLPGFLEMFGCCTALKELCGGLEHARIQNVLVSREDMTMEIDAVFASRPEAGELSRLESAIAGEFGLRSVFIRADYPREATAKKKEEKKKEKGSAGTALLGKLPKSERSIPIRDVTLESGTVTVTGKVFEITSRKIGKNNAAVLGFAVTDYTGSIAVSKFLRSQDDMSILDKIHMGDRLTVRGSVAFNRYDGDISIDPSAIVLEPPVLRMDAAPGEKRVELHLHTRFSTLDALTDPAAAVKTAARWGHKAIAVTDHGVAQAFPDIWTAGKKNGIKVIYGLEGYYVNDVDDLIAVQGETDLPLDTDFVGFDIETTGLDGEHDRITEIGAVKMVGGHITESFQTFVDPGMPIPAEIVQLTGITDRDVYGAPGEAEAVRAFMDFVGELPLAAHNAAFDVGFIAAAAERSGLKFDPVYVDTLAVARSLLRDQRRYTLDAVSRTLGLPEFNHHRASDDAAVCARIFGKLRGRYAAQGVTMLREIGPVSLELRKNENRRPRHIILLVQNKKGLKNLYELISRSHLEHFKKNPIIPKSLLMQYREGLIIGSACEAGEVFDAVERHRSRSELERLASFYDYLEIQPLCNNRFLIAEGKAKDDEALREFNRRVLALGRRLGKPVVATGDVHFLEPEDEIYRHILLASKKFADADRDNPLYFKTTDEMLEEFAYLGEADCLDVVVTAPNAIAESVETFELLPKDLFPPSIPHAAEDLEKMVWDKTHELYGDDPPAIVADRVKEELDAILGRHYEVIYMSAQKLVQNSLEHGYLVGSRGSVGSSIVAYMSGITEVNSLPPHYRCPKCRFSDFDNVYTETGDKYGCGADMPNRVCPVCGTPLMKDGFDIPFETFLGFGGDKVPDIDLNFSGEYQANAHKYTEELFGRDHVFRAGTIGTLAEKTAYGYVKKYLEERQLTVTKAEENRLAAGCVGVKRTTGQHPGGLVIIPQDKDVTDFCPVQHPADDATGGIITTHFEYHCMEANLLKLDELGHDDPTMIRMLEDATRLNARTVPLDDPETMRIFTTPAPLGLPEDDPVIGRTGTIGVPEFGTPFTRQMLVDTQPKEFATLVRLSGFSHGTDVWAGNIRDIVVKGIAPTDKCVGCRDDIMLYLIQMGMEPKRAFKFMEAVRKGAIHKGKPWPDGIVEEMQRLGVPEWWIESCRKIQYLFPKAHAVAYVMMAFRIAWFKVHEPLAYYSAYFYRRSQKDGFDAESMLLGIDRCREKIRKIQNDPDPSAKDQDLLTTLEAVYEFYLRGFTFLNIDIYKSDSTHFLIEDGKLRPPFVAISGLGDAAAEDLKKCRESGREFVSVDDISDACPKVSKAHIEQLKNLGALGDLPESRQVSLFDGF
jgi:DNA polymerase-3 subunit alpha (Gram-positive type)